MRLFWSAPTGHSSAVLKVGARRSAPPALRADPERAAKEAKNMARSLMHPRRHLLSPYPKVFIYTFDTSFGGFPKYHQQVRRMGIHPSTT